MLVPKPISMQSDWQSTSNGASGSSRLRKTSTMAISETPGKNSSQRSSRSSAIPRLRRQSKELLSRTETLTSSPMLKSLKKDQTYKPRRKLSSRQKKKKATEEAQQTHPLLKSIGVTEIPPLLQNMGVTPEALDKMDQDELREIVKRVQTLSRKLRFAGPQNDDELWLWVNR